MKTRDGVANDGIYAGVELGGTKIVCAIGKANGTLIAREEIPTQDPEITLAAVRDVLDRFEAKTAPPLAIGIAAFGPVHLHPSTSNFGCIGETPKLEWRGVNLRHAFTASRNVPIAIQTDVNCAAIGEATWGAAVDCDPVVYITVGTGIGGGVLVHGRAIVGLLHPEIGHMRVPRAPNDSYEGCCPHHRDCVEGLAAGPSITTRWDAQLADLPSDHPAYAIEAHYLSHLVVNTMLAVSPQRIVLGGGVMTNEALFPLIRTKVRDLLGGYIRAPEIEEGIETFIVSPGLGADAGVQGAIALAALRSRNPEAVIRSCSASDRLP